MPKDRSFYSLSKNDRVLHVCGVPTSYLKKIVSPQQLSFDIITLTNTRPAKTITPKDQLEVFQELLKNLDCIGQSALYGIGSFPTDQAAYQMSTIITKSYYDYSINNSHYPNIKWIDVARPDWDFLKSKETCDLLFVHGVTSNSDSRRIELTRDFIHRADNATKFIVTFTPKILGFLTHTLGLSPDGVFQLTKTVNRVLV